MAARSRHPQRARPAFVGTPHRSPVHWLVRALAGSGVALVLLASTGCGDDGASACAEPAATYGSVGKPFVDKYCASCHAGTLTGSARQGAPAGYVFDTLAQVESHAKDIHQDVVVTMVMPFGSASLKPTAAEREQFGKWLDCGAPE
jgi:uncharacterized membrane protein